jgi:hypothetical protein
MIHQSGKYASVSPLIVYSDTIKFEDSVRVIIDASQVRVEFTDSNALTIGRFYPTIRDDTTDPNISHYWTSHPGRVYRRNFSIMLMKDVSKITGTLLDDFGSPDQTADFLNKKVSFDAQRIKK